MHLPIVLCCGTQRALFTNNIVIRLVPNSGMLRLGSTYLASYLSPHFINAFYECCVSPDVIIDI